MSLDPTIHWLTRATNGKPFAHEYNYIHNDCVNL